MDIGLPDTDGFTLTSEIHEKCSANNKTRIVALTAHTDESYKEKVVKYGLVGLITKPLTKDNFNELLQKLNLPVA
jgi:DNA-binding NarL/FixJ family response regulator